MPVSAKPAAKRTILIVEDELLLAEVLKHVLETAGYKVLELADRHQQALALAEAGKPDLALVNIGLADGDNGVALAGDLNALAIPVLFISGNADRARKARTFAIASLAKPYSMKDAVSAVNYLFRHETGDESQPGPRQLEMFD
jgi:1,2-diacylglycerol 3-beta-glucosyltransferase